jgi:hypothetical protein
MKPSPFSSFSAVGYFLNPTVMPSRHSLCGIQSIDGAISPNTGLPLLLIATLDLTDERLGVPTMEVGSISLLYSWVCGISGGELTYRQSSRGVDLLKFEKGPLQGDFPYEGYPSMFPRVELELTALTVEDQSTIQKINRRQDDPVALEHQFPQLALPRAQVGGEPRLMQWPSPEFHCPICSGPMPFLAAIGDYNGDPRGFTGNAFVQMISFLCSACTVVTVCNLTD